MAESEMPAGSKKRIGIILGDDIEESAIPAIKYLILRLNSLQSHFEYAFFPSFDDSLFDNLSQKGELDRQKIKGLLPGFLKRYENFITEQQIAYGLQDTESLPDHYILIGLMRFSDEYYLTGIKRLGIIALGNWKRFMAPPSLLEFILTMVLVESVYVLRRYHGLGHLGTKGCLFDFTVELSDARYGTLQSFICCNCRKSLAEADYPDIADQLVKIMDKSWLGKSDDPSSPAGIISNLKYDLFLTKGLVPTFWERTLVIIQTDGVKEILKFVGAILVAGAILYLGWKK